MWVLHAVAQTITISAMQSSVEVKGWLSPYYSGMISIVPDIVKLGRVSYRGVGKGGYPPPPQAACFPPPRDEATLQYTFRRGSPGMSLLRLDPPPQLKNS